MLNWWARHSCLAEQTGKSVSPFSARAASPQTAGVETMAIRITCSGCQTALTLSDAMRGKKVRCKACAKVLSIPAKSLAKADEHDEEAIQDQPRLKASKASAPVEDEADGDQDRPAKKKKKKKSKQGPNVLLIGGAAAIFVVLIAVGGLSAFIFLKPAEQKQKQEQVAKAPDAKAKAPDAKEKDDRTPQRIIFPKIEEGNPAKKGGTGITSDVRGAGYRTERRSELRQIAIAYVQYYDEYKGSNRNMDTWLEHIKTFGPICDAVKKGYYKMNFNARLESGSVIAYERDIDTGQKHLCAFFGGDVDYVPLAELKTVLGRDP
jgi:hypothetical protein